MRANRPAIGNGRCQHRFRFLMSITSLHPAIRLGPPSVYMSLQLTLVHRVPWDAATILDRKLPILLYEPAKSEFFPEKSLASSFSLSRAS